MMTITELRRRQPAPAPAPANDPAATTLTQAELRRLILDWLG